MAKNTSYVAKTPDASGFINYTDEENKIWNDLITRQIPILEGRACSGYITGLERLDLPEDKIPQCKDLNKILKKCTGWEMVPVPALINFTKFFNMLANKQFPAASFIRSRKELDYLQEPDIFHEVFGHGPLLTNNYFADFTQAYGKVGASTAPKNHAMLARLYWFTVEFGLLNTAEGKRIAGAGVLSSYKETLSVLEENNAIHKPFEPIDVLRTPYRIDIIQPVYFVLESLEQLGQLKYDNLFTYIKKAKELGMHPPPYEEKSTILKANIN